MLPDDPGVESCLAQPPELIGRGIGPVEVRRQRRDGVFGALRHDHVAEHEAPARTKDAAHAVEEAALLAGVQVVNRQRREDEVEGAARQRLLQPRDS